MRLPLLALIVAGNLGGGADIGPPPVSAVPLLTPQYFTATSFVSPEQLTAQPVEPTTLYATPSAAGFSGYDGKMVLQPDMPNRWRIKAGTTQRVVFGAANLDRSIMPGQSWFQSVSFYAVGNTDANGNLLSASDIAAGKGITSAVATQMIKNSRTTSWGESFFSIGFAVDIDNTTAAAADRCIWLYGIGTPKNGYARRTKPICLVLEGNAATRNGASYYVDTSLYNPAVASNPSSGSGTTSDPFTNIAYALFKAATLGGAAPGNATKPMTAAAPTIYVDSSNAPALLDYSFVGSGALWGYDHIEVHPWPGRNSRVQIARSAFGHVDFAQTTSRQLTLRNVYLPYYRVTFFEADIDLSNIAAFSVPSMNGRTLGYSIGFVNCRTMMPTFNNDHLWFGEGNDFLIDWQDMLGGVNNLVVNAAPMKEPYQGFVINCSGRLGASAGFTLINGGHFVTSWDAVYVQAVPMPLVHFDYSAQQTTGFYDPLHGMQGLLVASVIPDTVGQRTVIKLQDEVFAGVATVSITNNVVTVQCFAADGKTLVVHPFQTLGLPFYPGSGAPQTLLFSASESSNPIAGVPLTVTAGIAASGSMFSAAASASGSTLANTSGTLGPFHFTFNTVIAESANAKGEGRHVFILSGAAKTPVSQSDGFTSGYEPSLILPDFIANNCIPPYALTSLGVSAGRASPAAFVSAGNDACVPALKAGTPNLPNLGKVSLPTGTLSGNILTFAGSLNSIAASNGLTTSSTANGKIGAFQSALATNALLWGMTVRVGSRVIGRVGQTFNATASAVTDANGVTLQPYSFFIEAWDGGSDVVSSAWSLSYDLHGLSTGNDLTLNGESPRYEILSVNGPVLTLGGSPAPASNTITSYAEFLSAKNKQVVVTERSYDAYGNSIARKTANLAQGDKIRIASVLQHTDAFQVQGLIAPCAKMENSLVQCTRLSGGLLQAIQMGSSYSPSNVFSAGTLTTHAAGDGFGSNDGLDVQLNVGTASVASIASTTPTVYWIDGQWFNGWRITSNFNTTIDTALVPFAWWEPSRAIRFKFTSGAQAGRVFRVYVIYNGAGTITMVFLDENRYMGSTPGSGTLSLSTNDQFLQPLPLDAQSAISVGSGYTMQARLFTPSAANPYQGRIHRPWYGTPAGGATISWYASSQVKDYVALATTCLFGVPGMLYAGNGPGGGDDNSIGWNNFGYVQSSYGCSSYASVVSNLAITPAFKVGMIDSIHGGLGAPSYKSANGLDKSEALFDNTIFNRWDTVARGNNFSPEMFYAADFNCTSESSITTVADPGTQQIIAGVTVARRNRGLFGWDCLGNPIPTDGSAIVGARQAA